MLKMQHSCKGCTVSMFIWSGGPTCSVWRYVSKSTSGGVFQESWRGEGECSVFGEQVVSGLEKVVHGTEHNHAPNQWEIPDSASLNWEGTSVFFPFWKGACIMCLIMSVITGKHCSKPGITWHTWWFSFVWIIFPLHTFLESQKAFYGMRSAFSKTLHHVWVS